MSRFYLRLIALPFLVFSAVLLLILAQPSDDRDLRQLLAPDGCSASCFMGIQPGFTTTDEAMRILNSSGWVETMTVGNVVVTWTWNGKQPQWIDASQSSQLTVITNTMGQEVVNDIRIPTRIVAGSIMLAMQNPLAFMLTTDEQPNGTKTHFVSLRYNDLVIKGVLSCPARIHKLVEQSAIITFYNHNNANFDFEEQFWNKGQLISFTTDRFICD